MKEETTLIRKPKFWEALIPILVLMVLLGINVYIFGDSASSGPNQIALILAATVGSLIALRLGFKWEKIKNGMVSSIASATGAILILLLIGSLAGTWLISGIVPTMIYYGLEILNPTIFLAASCIVCAIVAVATGSSWSTIATVGIALLGIGKVLGMNEGMVAGAIISGAYFGDKMSPLSDTTNLAPAMAGTDLFTHIRYMLLTTVPSVSIALILFLALGFSFDPEGEITDVAAVQGLLEKSFYISPVLFIVPVLVIILIIRKVPALPALLIGTLLGGLFAVIFQTDLLLKLSGKEDLLRASYKSVLQAMFTSVSISTGNPIVDDLLGTKGMEGMLNTVWLVLCAMAFGGVMEVSGLLQRISEAVIKRATSVGSLVASTVGTCLFFNITAADQYLAIVVPGRMYADAYRRRGLAPENLSRALEDSGTVTSVLIPWNTCGVAQAGVLNVAVMSFAPYCFFNIISPFMSIIFASFNIKIATLTEEEKQKTTEGFEEV